MVRRIKLSPVREKEAENYRRLWKRRSQVLGSVLHWAHDAGASRVEFDPGCEEPFTYTTANGRAVVTALGGTPPEDVETIERIIRDTIDGHPLSRPLRRLYRGLKNQSVCAEIEIPPTPVYSGSTWFCRMAGGIVTFDRKSTAEPIQT